MPALTVWYENQPVGQLEWDAPTWRFTYDPAWLTAEDRFWLSPHFPLLPAPFSGDSVLWFFQNLLPEGRLLEAIALKEGVRKENVFALLKSLGRECAGALTIVAENENISTADEHYRKLTDDELLAWVSNRANVPLTVAARETRMSLAGAQEKLAVRIIGDELYLPERYAPTTHLLKPQNFMQDRYPNCVANEYFCMRLAARMGLPVPPTMLRRVGNQTFYCVERYDRVITPEGVVKRLHQNDLCQVLDRWPEYKYEEMGGAVLPEYFAALDQYTAKSAPARLTLLRWVAFNFLIGNSDAHAKNVSFLLRGNALDLAPFYDLLCIKVYGDVRLAASIGRHNQYGWVVRADWDTFAGDCGLDIRLVTRVLRDFASRLPGEAEFLLNALPLNTAEKRFVSDIVEVIRVHSRYVIEEF